MTLSTTEPHRRHRQPEPLVCDRRQFSAANVRCLSVWMLSVSGRMEQSVRQHRQSSSVQKSCQITVVQLCKCYPLNFNQCS